MEGTLDSVRENAAGERAATVTFTLKSTGIDGLIP
jgi:hypothetical protein